MVNRGDIPDLSNASDQEMYNFLAKLVDSLIDIDRRLKELQDGNS